MQVITGSDADEDVNSEVVVSVSGDFRDHFNVTNIGNDATGLFKYQLVVIKEFDYDSLQEKALKMSLIVTDKGSPARSSTSALIVNILDVNDNTPSFKRVQQSPLKVREDFETNKTMVSFSATDKDSGYNGAVTYALDQFQEGGFSIGEHTGQLSLVESLNYEKRREYLVQVRAVDAGIPIRTATATVTIQVVDVNDNSPVFTASLYIGEVKENLANAPVMQVSAEDKDSDAFGKVIYSLSNSTKYFKIDPNSGVVSTSSPLDFEELKNPEIRLLVQARDNDVDLSNRRTSTATLLIRCLNVNDVPPVFDKKVYTATVKAGQDPLVTVVRATDQDTPVDKLTYSVLSPTAFTIDKHGVIMGNGYITTSTPTQITVEVRDGVAKATATVQVRLLQ